MALRGGSELGALLTVLNRVIFDLKSPAMYATFAGLQWREGALSFAVAAHAPILRHRHGSPVVEELTMTQLPIAMFEDTQFAATPLEARPGDLFVILTDGLTEVFDGAEREFGLDRMKAIIAAHADGPLEIARAAHPRSRARPRSTAGRSVDAAGSGSCRRLRRQVDSGVVLKTPECGSTPESSGDSGVVRTRAGP